MGGYVEMLASEHEQSRIRSRRDIMRGVKAKRKQFNDTQDEKKELPWVGGTRNPWQYSLKNVCIQETELEKTITKPTTAHQQIIDSRMKSTKMQTLGGKLASCSIAVCWAVHHRQSQ